MGKRRHTCGCYDCLDSGIKRKELQHGGNDWEADDEELVPYKKPSRSNWNGKKKRACKKSKTGEPCDSLAKVVKGSRRVYNPDGTYGGYKPYFINACSRCGKHDWTNYNWWW